MFLEGVKSALIAARGGLSLGVGLGQRYPSNEPWTPQQREVGLKAFGRVYAGWGFSQAWYRHKLFSKFFGAKDEEEFLQTFWEPWGLKNDPDDLLVMLRTWQLGDISRAPEFGGDLTKALQSIKCRVVVAPVETDMYFLEGAHLPWFRVSGDIGVEVVQIARMICNSWMKQWCKFLERQARPRKLIFDRSHEDVGEGRERYTLITK